MERTRSLGLIAAALLMAMGGRAQNLVRNGSFEEYTECPPSFGYWANVVGWISPYTQSADYYNACASGIVCSVPLNYGGFQYPAGGDAYMGIITYSTAILYREVIATELTEALQPGVPTFVSYKVSSGGGGANINNTPTWAAKGPGANFFMQLPETSQPWLFSGWASYLFPNYAVIDMPGVLNDTVNWVTVSGAFVPDSAYTWLAIANYFENDLSQLELLDSTAQSNTAYAYVDEVCVSQVPGYCDGSTNVGSSDPPTIPVRWVTAEGSIYLDWGQLPITHVRIMDALGQTLSQEKVDGRSQITIGLHGWSAGCYLVVAEGNDFKEVRKLVITH